VPNSIAETTPRSIGATRRAFAIGSGIHGEPGIGIARQLGDAGIEVVLPEVGELATSLDMAVCSLTLSWRLINEYEQA
jgi:dihydroxyacetone kinase